MLNAFVPKKQDENQLNIPFKNFPKQMKNNFEKENE